MKKLIKGNLETGIITIAATIIFYSVFILYGDIQSLISVSSSIKPTDIALVVSITIISILLRFLRWEEYLKTHKIDISIGKSINYFLSGFSMIITPGKAGEGIKCYLMRRDKNIGVDKTLPIVILERISDLFALVIVTLTTYSLVYLSLAKTILILIFSLAMPFLILQHRRQLKQIFRKVEPSLPLIEDKINRISHILDKNDKLLDPKNQIKPTIYSVSAWTLNGLSLYIVVVKSLGKISIPEALLSFSSSSIAGAISMIPGGLGVVEGSMTGTMQIFGMSKSASVASTIILRIFSFWLIFIIGAIILTKHFHKTRRK